MSKTRALLFAVLLLTLAAPAAASKPPVMEVATKMQKFYNATLDLKGKFKQVYTDKLYGTKRTSHGYLYVKKPGMMRWNYVKPERKSFIADGTTLWIHEPEDKQAFRNPLDTNTLSTGLTFLFGKGDLTKEFIISYATDKKDVLGGPGDLVLKLVPKTPTAQYEYLLMAIKPSNYSVGESMVVKKQDRNHFIFTRLTFNTKLQKWRFKFKPPAGTRVIDARRLKNRP